MKHPGKNYGKYSQSIVKVFVGSGLSDIEILDIVFSCLIGLGQAANLSKKEMGIYLSERMSSIPNDMWDDIIDDANRKIKNDP